MSSELYLCIHARGFPAQALLRLRPELRDRAVAVMEGDAPFQTVCSLNKHARMAGVAPGMSFAEMESFPSVALLKRSFSEERTAQNVLFECAGKYSPRVEKTCNGSAFGCVLDIAGTEKLFGSTHMVAMRVLEDLNVLGIQCSIAVSSNFHASVCLSRGASARKRPVVVPTGQERQALASLPISVLNISVEHAETFEQWGVSTLGTLAMLPERDLISRLGQEGGRLRHLARGESPHLFLPIEPAVALEEHIELDSPIDVLDSLLFGAGVMLEQLIIRARAQVLSLASVTSELGLDGGEKHIRIVRPALPSSDKYLWIKLMHLDLIAHPPQAAVVSLRLRAESGEASKVQLGLFSPQLPEAARLDVTLARIHAVVGEGRAGSVELKDTHGPDDFRMKPFSLFPALTDKTAKCEATVAMRCLRPPESVSVTLRNNYPHIFYFRGIAYQAEKTYGPWRAAGGWWMEGQWSLEEWDVIARTRGNSFINHPESLLCCCMTHNVASGHWQVEALYD